MPSPEKRNDYTFADMLEMEEEYIEIIDGELYMMAEPTLPHQIISGELFAQLHAYLVGKKCRVVYSPFAARLFEKEGDDPKSTRTVVEPDLAVICDREKIDRRGCKGAPDLVIEILSPSNRKRDLHIKYILYQKAGVREYWIVNPDMCTVSVHTLQEDELYGSPMVYTRDSTVPVGVLEDCNIDLTPVFDAIDGI